MSMSLNYAVLYNKPVILLDSDNFNSNFKNYLCLYETELGAHKMNISKDKSIKFKDIAVDKNKYKNFKEKYIKESNTPEKYVWEIFCDELSKNEKISHKLKDVFSSMV